MTTIAYKDGIMVGDTLALDPNGLKSFYPKVFVVNIGGELWLFGSAGETSVAHKLRRSLEGVPSIQQVLDSDITCDPDDKNAALLCRGDVVISKIGSTWRKWGRDYHAIGSGRDFALAAMYLGQTAHEAVELAKGFDGYSGGDVTVITIGEA